VVTEFLAANTMAFSWKHPNDVAETQVRFKLSPQGGRTLVQLDLQGFTSPDSLDKAVNFWVFNEQNLKSVIENQIDLRQTQKTASKPAPRPTAHAAVHHRAQ
jgi:hypothetical protein